MENFHCMPDSELNKRSDILELKNSITVCLDIDNNLVKISDTIGMVNIQFDVLAEYEIDACTTREEYIKAYRESVNTILYKDTIKPIYIEAYIQEFMSNTDIIINSPFEFKGMSSGEFEEEFGIGFLGNGPVIKIQKCDTDENFAVCAVSRVVSSKQELEEFIRNNDPIMYRAQKNSVDQYKIRYYTLNDEVVSSIEYSIHDTFIYKEIDKCDMGWDSVSGDIIQ